MSHATHSHVNAELASRSEAILARARAMRAEGLYYKQIADALVPEMGRRVSIDTVFRWLQGATRPNPTASPRYRYQVHPEADRLVARAAELRAGGLSFAAAARVLSAEEGLSFTGPALKDWLVRGSLPSERAGRTGEEDQTPTSKEIDAETAAIRATWPAWHGRRPADDDELLDDCSETYRRLGLLLRVEDGS